MVGINKFGTAFLLPLILLAACDGGPKEKATTADAVQLSPADTQRLTDGSDGADWPAYGRTYGEQHFSPLSEIDASNVNRLNLAWYMDLDVGNSVTAPVAVDGILYFSHGLSVVRAVDAATGEELWVYDSNTHEHAGKKLRQGWGNRGIAYWNGKVYTGTNDGRLIAIDAKTGKEVWSTMTVGKDDGRYITGAPRVFEGKIIIGHGGGDSADIRGYVTTYNAETGKELWRFYLVPGNPADGFEDETQEMAAKTWAGEWWKYGGGGNAWNAFTYDADTDTVLIGTGNGAPWNHRIRSNGEGDNLFVTSIVGLDAKTGAYKWHYQFNPGETWDYNAAMDMELADLEIDGTPRKVVMTAPKNGFFYVIDRTNGKLLSAEKIAKVTWASHIDLETGRPVEIPGARFPDGKPAEIWPSYRGAHSWMPMAFSPQTSLVYIPKLESGALYSDKSIKLKGWQRVPGNASDMGIALGFEVDDPLHNTSSLVAWNPITQKKAWEVKTIGGWNGGIMATGGNLVFQGQLDGRFSAYAADSGKELWHFPAQAAVLAAPISYQAGGKQHVTVIVGMGTSVGSYAAALGGLTFDYRTQKRRVLTFTLDGEASLPPAPPPFKVQPVDDPDYKPDAALADAGALNFGTRCVICHGINGIAAGLAPDLRASLVPQSAETFTAIVRDGGLRMNGMPSYEEFSDQELEALRQHIRQLAADLRKETGGKRPAS